MSKGTYIRSICEQIGKKLGCGAVMTFLVRTRSGGFDIGQSVTLEEIIAEIQEKEHLTYEEVVNPGKKPSQLSFVPDFLMPVGDMLTDFGKILLNGDEMKKYVNGGKPFSAECRDPQGKQPEFRRQIPADLPRVRRGRFLCRNGRSLTKKGKYLR